MRCVPAAIAEMSWPANEGKCKKEGRQCRMDSTGAWVSDEDTQTDSESEAASDLLNPGEADEEYIIVKEKDVKNVRLLEFSAKFGEKLTEPQQVSCFIQYMYMESVIIYFH